MSNTIKLSLLSVALLSQVHASEAITLAPIAITSTAIKTDELKSTDAVEVYTGEDIQKAHVQNVYEFLNQQTSVTAVSSYGNPFTPILDLRGYGMSNGNQNIVVTIDGRKLNNIDSVPQLLGSISPASVSRIEILKSSGIVLAGDGATAGVINIITKKNNDKEIKFYIGNFGLVDGSFYVGHKDDKLSISLAGESQKSDGSKDVDLNGNRDSNKFTTAAFNMAYLATQDLELRFGADYSNMDVTYGGYLTKAQYKSNPRQKGAFVVSQAYKTKIVHAGASYFLNDNITFKIDGAKENKTSAYIPSTTQSDYKYNSLKAVVKADYDSFALSAGVDAFYGNLTTSSDKTSKDNLAAFVMSEFYLGKTTLKAGYRYEKVSYAHKSATKDLSQNDHLNGVELGANQLINKNSSVFVSYAHAYQAPNIDSFFKADYSNYPTVTKGFNNFIDPMTSDSFNLGYNYILNSNKLKIAFYYIDLKNEIYLHKPDYKNTNLDKSHKYGFDLFDKYIINSEFNIALNYNYVKAIIDKEQEGSDNYAGKELPGVSNHNAKANLTYAANPYTSFSLIQEYHSEAYAADDFNNNFTQKQEAYYPTNVSLTIAKDNWEVFAKINNLFNQASGLWIKNDAVYPINVAVNGLVGFKLKY